MAVTCGLPLNGAMASAINTLDDVHGGAGEQAMALYADIAARVDAGTALTQATADAVATWQQARGKHFPGFGHRFHPLDPRAPRLLALVDQAAQARHRQRDGMRPSAAPSRPRLRGNGRCR